VDGERTNSIWLRRLAVATAVVSLLPIGMGALVTTLGAGMAFPDWPTSDGQAMLSYPWHLSVGNKFVEHGHRLAGILIGLFSVILCVVAWSSPASKAVRIACTVVLAAVVVQGALGGLRVLLNETVLAFGHSVFGCLVFVSLWLVVLMQLDIWQKLEPVESAPGSLPGLAVVFPAFALLQYVMGGAVRHFGRAIDIHLIGAGVVVMLSVIVAVVSKSSDSRLIRRLAWIALAAMSLQVTIGVATWVTKYGLPELGLVAVQHSVGQVVARTLHTVVGMIFVASAVNWSLVVLRTVRAGTVSSTKVALR
jgi:heme a synthase